MMERERWTSRMAFVMAAIGSAVGLGNVWRFPFVAYQNGGGAFLIPYLVALFTAGIPLMVLEYGLGKMMQAGAPTAFAKVKDKLEWVGWWAILVGFTIVIYYAVVMAWCWGYLYHSLFLSWKGRAEDFFYKDFLGLSDGPGKLGGLRLPVVVGLVLTWASIVWIVQHGVRRVGRVVMVTVPLPVILLAIFVLRGATLPGAMEGLKFYLTPDFSKLAEPRTWLAAYGQIFFSLSLAFGIMIAYASYLHERADVNNNAFITALANCGTSYFAGFAVFTVLGYMAHVVGKPVAEVVSGGPGLAFVTYPTAISLLPTVPAVFGFIFFLTLLSLGIDSAFSLVEAAVTAVHDRWPISRRKATWLLSGIAFLGGLLFTTKGGLYWLDIVDHFANNYGLVGVGLAESLIVGYVLGAERFREHVNMDSEVKLGRWWDFCIKFLTPAILGILVVWSLAREFGSPYSGYPGWALLVGGWGVILLQINLGVALMSRRAFLRASLPASASLVAFAVLLEFLPPMWIMFIVASAVLYGGLAWSLSRARRGYEGM